MDLLFDKTSDEAEVDRSIIKIGGLAVVGAASSFVFGFFLKLFILEKTANYFVFSLSGAVCFLVVFLLQTFFIKTLWRANLIIFLEALGLAAGFYDKISSSLLISASLVFLILIWANYNGYRELQNTLKIRFFRVGKAVFPKAVMALALFASVVYYNNLSGLTDEEFFISRSSFGNITAPAFGVVNKLNILPEINPSSSIAELINEMAAEQIEENPQLRLLPPAMKERLIAKAVKETEAQISDFLGMSVKPESTIGAALYDAMVDKFSKISDNAKKAILVAVAAAIFLTIEGFSWPIRVAVSILAWIVYEVLLAAGFATVALEDRKRETTILN